MKNELKSESKYLMFEKIVHADERRPELKFS
jgi:hypothetical protein